MGLGDMHLKFIYGVLVDVTEREYYSKRVTVRSVVSL